MKRLALLALACASTAAAAPISFTGGTYSQNFNSLASTGTANAWTDGATLPGWYAGWSFVGTASPGAPSPIPTYRADDGTWGIRALASYGSVGSSERALGSITDVSGGAQWIGFKVVNNTSEALNRITISYTGEQWHESNVGQTTLEFQYRVGDGNIYGSSAAWVSVPELDFDSLQYNPAPLVIKAVDGNDPANRTLVSATFAIPDALPGQILSFRWHDPNNPLWDQGLAIDDLTFEASSVAVPTPAAIGSGLLLCGIMAWQRRRRG